MNFKNRKTLTKEKKPPKPSIHDIEAIRNPYFSAATKLLEKRKEMFDIQSALSAKRQEFKKRLDLIKDKEEELTKTREKLTDNIIDLDNFIRENDMRREKAILKKKTEEKLCDQFDDVIMQKREEIIDLEQSLKQKKELLDTKYQKYYKYLHEVVYLARGQDNPDEVEVLMKRYNSLKTHNEELNNGIAELKEELTNAQKELFKYQDQRLSEIMNFTEDIAKLKRMDETMRDSSNEAQRTLDESQRDISKNKVIQGQVEMACKNLYTRVKSVTKIQRNKFAPGDKSLEKMLEDILKYVEDYGKIAALIVQKQNEDDLKKKQKHQEALLAAQKRL